MVSEAHTASIVAVDSFFVGQMSSWLWSVFGSSVEASASAPPAAVVNAPTAPPAAATPADAPAAPAIQIPVSEGGDIAVMNDATGQKEEEVSAQQPSGSTERQTPTGPTGVVDGSSSSRQSCTGPNDIVRDGCAPAEAGPAASTLTVPHLTRECVPHIPSAHSLDGLVQSEAPHLSKDMHHEEDDEDDADDTCFAQELSRILATKQVRVALFNELRASMPRSLGRVVPVPSSVQRPEKWSTRFQRAVLDSVSLQITANRLYPLLVSRLRADSLLPASSCCECTRRDGSADPHGCSADQKGDCAGICFGRVCTQDPFAELALRNYEQKEAKMRSTATNVVDKDDDTKSRLATLQREHAALSEQLRKLNEENARMLSNVRHKDVIMHQMKERHERQLAKLTRTNGVLAHSAAQQKVECRRSEKKLRIAAKENRKQQTAVKDQCRKTIAQLKVAATARAHIHDDDDAASDVVDF